MSFQKWMSFVQFWEHFFNVGRKLRQVKVSEGQFSSQKVILFSESSEEIEFCFDFLFGLFLLSLSLFAPNQFTNWFFDILDDANQFIDKSLLFKIMAQQILLTWFSDNVSVDGIRLSKFELSINEVRKVGEG